MALRRLELDESRDIAKYAKQLKDLGDEPSINILKQPEDEREHYRILSGLIRNRRPIRLDFGNSGFSHRGESM